MTLPYQAMHMLARIPEDAPERCLYQGHNFSDWSNYAPERTELVPYFDEGNGPVPTKAWRSRECRQCGCQQNENYDHSVRKVVADPCGIAARLKQLDNNGDQA